MVLFFKKKNQFFESYSKIKRFNSLRHIKEIRVQFFGHIPRKRVEFCESYSKKKFNSVTHTGKKFQLFESCKKRFNSLSYIFDKNKKSSILWVVPEKGSILWVVPEKGFILWVVLEKMFNLWVILKKQVQVFESCSKKKGFNYVSHIQENSVLWVEIEKKGSILWVIQK